jgi:LmbE family N-acetylglucosaminyl deacetylase
MEEKLSILAVVAHPDDMEILCGGTMAKFSKLGHKVNVCHVCDGGKGSKSHNSGELITIRHKEAMESAKLIKAETLWAGIPDGEVVLNLDNRIKIIDIIRKSRPDLILTHSPGDYHVDHINTGKLVFEAIYLADLPLFKTKNRETEKLPFLYYMETLGSSNFVPEEYVDITDTIDIKIEMMLKMGSQLGWLKEMHNCDAAEYIKTVAAFRGYQSGVKYAEAFVQQKMYPQGLTKRILP